MPPIYRKDPEPYRRPQYNGPIWIDPRYLERHGWYVETITTNTTQPVAPVVIHESVSEDRLREIVREEIADLPIPFDVPDAPPEDPTDG